MVNPTLVILWVFTWCSVALISVRLVLRKIRRKPFNGGDYLSLGAIFCILARLGIVHVILIWGTNNMPKSFRETHHFSATELYHRETGSKLTLANRVFYNSYLWLQKIVLLDTYRHLVRNLPYERMTLTIFLGTFLVTYVTVQVVTFTECDPFHLYYQVLPDPGVCTQAQLQLIVVGVLNIVTDVMLIALPIPVLIMVKRSFMEKLQLAGLFAVGFFIVIITIVRLPQNAAHSTAQVNRTTWASIEELAASFVANAPVIYGFYKGARENSRQRTTGGTSLHHSSSGTRGGGAVATTQDRDWELRRISGTHIRRTSMLGSKRIPQPSHVYTELDDEASKTSVDKEVQGNVR